MKRYAYLELRCDLDGSNVTITTTSSSVFGKIIRDLGEHVEDPNLTRKYYDIAGNLYQATLHNLFGAERDARVFVWIVRWLSENGWELQEIQNYEYIASEPIKKKPDRFARFRLVNEKTSSKK